MKPALLSTIFVLTLLGVGASPGSPPPALDEALKAVTDLPRYRAAQWGLLVVDLADGRVLLERQADKLFQPASVTKLFSVAATWDALGPDYRFRTKLLHTGEYDASSKTVDGDLILLASGDLTLGGRTLPNGAIAYTDEDRDRVDPRQGLRRLARDVAEKVAVVKGDVLVDDRLFDKTKAVGGEKLTPVMVNDNVLAEFVITPGEAEGKPGRVEYRPKQTLTVENYIETVARGQPQTVTIAASRSQPGKYVVRGKIPLGQAPFEHQIEVDDPPAHLRRLLIEALTEAGVKVAASPTTTATAERLPSREAVAKLPSLAELVSQPFSEHAKLILKVSHNHHADTLPLLLAAQAGKRTFHQGMRLEGERLRALGVPVDMISLGSGSGGSPADLVTPRATVSLLCHMAGRPDFDAFRRALPILGVDGTLATAVDNDSHARGKFQAKTGTIMAWGNGLGSPDVLGSKALAGYGETRSGLRVAFAFFVNRVPVDPTGAAPVAADLGRLCESVYQHAP